MVSKIVFNTDAIEFLVEDRDRLVQEIQRLVEDNKRMSNEYMVWKDNYYEKVEENEKWRDHVRQLMDTLAELQAYKEKIEKLPEYESWVAGFNCGGYHD